MTDEHQARQEVDNPGTRVPPPIFLIVVMLCGLGLQSLWELEFTNGSWRYVAGWASIGAGVFILVLGWVHFYREETNVLHHRPASKLIQSGIYRLSRNPIYVSALFLQLGIALSSNNLWIALLIPVSKIVLDRYVIAREEAYLERAFGEVYTEYKRSVRRWL